MNESTITRIKNDREYFENEVHVTGSAQQKRNGVPCENVHIDSDPCEVEIESDPCEDIPVSQKEARSVCDTLMRYFSQQVDGFEEVRTLIKIYQVKRTKTLTQTAITNFFC